MRQGDRLVPDEVKASGLQLSFNIFRQPSTQDSIETNCVKLQTIDPEICSFLIFQKRVWDQFLHHILCMNFQEKYSSCYILLTDEILLSDCLYFSKYWVVCVLQWSYYNCLLTRLTKFDINLTFPIKVFCYMTEKSRQKIKYLENEKSF